jgi:hypothetical protein
MGRNGTLAACTGKRSASFGGGTTATALCGRGKSGASYQHLGNIKRWAYWDSRRYRIAATRPLEPRYPLSQLF